MKHRVCLFLLLIVFTHAFSQQEDFIEFTNGEVTKGSKIEYKSPVFGARYLLVDGTTQYPLTTVTAYQIKGVYYKRLTPPGRAYADFYMRTAHGKIDAYVKIASNFYMQSNGTMTNNPSRWDYYSREGGPLKKARYRVLRKELKDSKKAMAVLNEIRTLRYVSAGLYLGGTALIVTGIAGTSGNSGIPTGVVVGALSFGVNRLLLDVKRNKLSDAIQAYNNELQ